MSERKTLASVPAHCLSAVVTITWYSTSSYPVCHSALIRAVAGCGPESIELWPSHLPCGKNHQPAGGAPAKLWLFSPRETVTDSSSHEGDTPEPSISTSSASSSPRSCCEGMKKVSSEPRGKA